MKIKELRQEKKLAQHEVAKLLNITQASYARYELDQSAPNLETLCKLADYYHVTLDYLVGREFANDAGYLTDDEKNLLTMYRKMNKFNKTKFIGEAMGILVVQDN